jgi:deazaflavin-dependent oxidoreductase (nitroreductase family)
MTEPDTGRKEAVLPGWMPRFNKALINRAQRVWAPYLPPLALLTHHGRRSGNAYRTPVLAFRWGNRFAVPLPYGSNADWVRNVLAAGDFDIRRAGRHFHLTNPRIVLDPNPTGLARFLRGAVREIPVLVSDVA